MTASALALCASAGLLAAFAGLFTLRANRAVVGRVLFLAAAIVAAAILYGCVIRLAGDLATRTNVTFKDSVPGVMLILGPLPTALSLILFGFFLRALVNALMTWLIVLGVGLGALGLVIATVGAFSLFPTLTLAHFDLLESFSAGWGGAVTYFGLRWPDLTAVTLGASSCAVLLVCFIAVRELHAARGRGVIVIRAFLMAAAVIAGAVLWGCTIRFGAAFAERMNMPSLNLVAFAIIMVGVYPAMFTVMLFGCVVKDRSGALATVVFTFGAGLASMGAVIATVGAFTSTDRLDLRQLDALGALAAGWSGMHWVVIGYMLFVLCVGAPLLVFDDR